MTNYGLIGADTAVDDLLAQYFPGRPNNLVYEAFESEQSALMAALLMEMRGDDIDQDVSGDKESTYYCEANIPVDSVEEETEQWDFTADTVVVFGFDAPIAIAYKDSNKSNRTIPLTPSEAPFSLSPPGGLGASQLWFSKQSKSDTDTTINVLALK